MATVVALLASTMIRVGNEEYARANDSYGLTTMLEEHVRISGDTVRFRFRGKSGREHSGVIEEFLANGAHSLATRKHRKKAAPGSHALSADELRVLNFIETLATRDENKHLGDLLAKSVLRAARNTRARTAVAR